MRPLDRLPSLKAKLSVVIVAAVAVSAGVSTVGYRIGVPLLLRPVIAGVLALAMVQLLARGMTSPLRQMAAAARSMRDGDHMPVAVTASRDEVGELARAFNAMAGELAEVDRVRRDLVANVSHELRTPISALQAVLENLVDGVADPDPSTLKTMLAQVERLGRLVAQLLDLSRLESGAMPLERVPFALGPLLERAADEARLVSPVPILVQLERADLTVDGDAERVHQVVANLVENAVRHSPSDGAVVLRASAVAGRVRLGVEDEGPGIPEAEAHRVFERFSRLDDARSSAGGGAGLGLAIARWIVDLHGGDIRVERRTPTGCRMVVELPRAPVPSTTGHRPPPSREGALR